ncbi:MAG: YlmC/YmxH family sporulation protein [Bacilli bacterium]|nr:YlmC/YmxH family sporulation protein [Bacilli bacterium]
MRLSDLQAKSIINVVQGKNLGRIVDVEIDIDGRIIYFVVEQKRLFRWFNNSGDVTVNFSQIKKIGDDVILVEL